MPAPIHHAGRHTDPKPRLPHSMRVGQHRVTLPRSRLLRVLLGTGLVMGGLLWFLPVLGLWMLPLGLGVLSIDLPPVRRWRRRMVIRWGRSGVRNRVRELKKARPRYPR